MVTKLTKQSGGALAITLLSLAMMIVLVLAMNKVVLVQQRSSANYADYELARSYAKLALLDAEETVFNYDQARNFDNTNSPQALNRYTAISSSTANIVTNGANCNLSSTNKGWCYISSGANKNYIESANFIPWEMTSSSSVKPCNNYTLNTTNVPIMDDQSSRYTIPFNTNDTSICVQPRYIIEPLNLDYRARFESDATYIYGKVMQVNSADLTVFRYRKSNAAVELGSPRLYRITVRAFGKSGDTRVTLQEYLIINQSSFSSTRYQAIIPVSIRQLK